VRYHDRKVDVLVTTRDVWTLDPGFNFGRSGGTNCAAVILQDGSGRGLFTVAERYFSDWYLFRLVRVGAAVFADAGRTWGRAPLTQPRRGWLEDAGFATAMGNARSGFGNVVHVDVAFPFRARRGVDKAQLLVQTQASL
jgi:hypothetical protein